MRVLVIQLARLGDILQTLPTIQALKKDGCHVTLLVRGTFADAARLSPHVDKLVEFPTRDILGPVTQDPGKAGKAASLAKLIAWTGSLLRDEDTGERIEPYDLVLNLTFSAASSYLAQIVPAKERRGVHRAEDGAYAIKDSWSQYFYAQVQTRNMNMIHLNDLFLRIAGAKGPAWPAELVDPRLAAPIPQPKAKGKRIGIQLTASRPEKTLNERVWNEIIRSILNTHEDAEIIFFGSAADIPAIEAVLADFPAHLRERCLVAAGTMRFHENVHWLRTCEWLVSPDTAIVHLASLCGTRVLYIPAGDVRPDDTGPYGEGHVVLYPGYAKGPQLAAEVANVVGGKPARNPTAACRTRLKKDSRGRARSELVPENFSPEEVRNFFTKAYYLLAEFRCEGAVEDIEIPRLGDPNQKDALDRLTTAFDALLLVRRLAEFGRYYCEEMLKHVSEPAELKTLMAKLNEAETMLGDLEKSVLFVKPLVDTWKVSRENVASGQLPELLGMTEGCFRELIENVDIIKQLMQTAVQAAQDRLTGTRKRPDNVKELDDDARNP